MGALHLRLRFREALRQYDQPFLGRLERYAVPQACDSGQVEVAEVVGAAWAEVLRHPNVGLGSDRIAERIWHDANDLERRPVEL